MKAVISNKIYLDTPPDGGKSIKDALTYRLVPKNAVTTNIKGQFIKKVEIIKAYSTLLNGKVLVIPQGRQDLIPEGYTIVDKRVTNVVPFPDPKFELNGDQLPVFNEVTDTCFINALVGWGKTFTALHIARKLEQKTLVIVHTVALRDQWADEVERLYGFRPGIIGSNNYDVDDHFIVVANIQTVAKVAEKYAKEFGTIIVDEAHHIPATTFTTTLEVFHARYRIGLSGTMIRKDGKEVLFQNSFGSTVYKPPKSNTIDPKVQILKTGFRLTQGVPWVNKMNNLLYDEDYQHFVADLAKVQIQKGHKVLIVADRTEFLEKVCDYVGKETCILITGSNEAKTQEVRNRLIKEVSEGDKMCIAGSRAIFTEGISVNILSCVILAVPSANESLLEQLIGRIMRQHPRKLDPVVVDLNFAGYDTKKQNEARLAFYLTKGWQIQFI